MEKSAAKIPAIMHITSSKLCLFRRQHRVFSFLLPLFLAYQTSTLLLLLFFQCTSRKILFHTQGIIRIRYSSLFKIRLHFIKVWQAFVTIPWWCSNFGKWVIFSFDIYVNGTIYIGIHILHIPEICKKRITYKSNRYVNRRRVVFTYSSLKPLGHKSSLSWK